MNTSIVVEPIDRDRYDSVLARFRADSPERSWSLTPGAGQAYYFPRCGAYAIVGEVGSSGHAYVTGAFRPGQHTGVSAGAEIVDGVRRLGYKSIYMSVYKNARAAWPLLEVGAVSEFCKDLAPRDWCEAYGRPSVHYLHKEFGNA